jgi:RHS repeat-associated protein
VGAYFPYGEDRGSLPNDLVKFATYTRDSMSGMDYAMNRHYMSGAGRFSTVDPKINSGSLTDPGSLNRYGYTRGNPVGY